MDNILRVSRKKKHSGQINNTTEIFLPTLDLKTDLGKLCISPIASEGKGYALERKITSVCYVYLYRASKINHLLLYIILDCYL